MAHRQQLYPADEVGQQRLPDQHVEQAHGDGAGGRHGNHDEDRVVDHRAGQRPDEQGDGELAGADGDQPGVCRARGRDTAAARDQGGDQLGDRGEDDGQPGRDDELRHHHRGPADRRGQQVDDAAVVDLGAEHAGADDQRGQRDQHREAERAQDVRRPGPHRRARGPQRDREQDQDHRGQREQQRPLAAQRRAQRDPRDRRVEQGGHVRSSALLFRWAAQSATR